MNYQAPGNAEVIATLEKFLAIARQGETTYVGIMAGENSGKFTTYWGGARALLWRLPEALEKFGGAVEAEILNYTLPERDPTLAADHVCYDLAAGPTSFDFLPWLVDAEMTRVREGAPAPLKVAFWCGRDAKSLGPPIRHQMFEKVLRPLVQMIGGVEADNTGGRFKKLVGLRDVTAGYRAGEKVPKLASPVAIAEHDYVTITLRENPLWMNRNSNFEAWMRFAGYLAKQGEQVIVVRETAKAFEPLELPADVAPQVATFPHAAIELPVRVALYQNAKLNFFMANGPFGLALFMDRPWIAFNVPNPPGVPYHPNLPEFWRDFQGIEYGEQFPWCRPDQRIVWAADDYDNLVKAWEER